jgi:hypothetical protein
MPDLGALLRSWLAGGRDAGARSTDSAEFAVAGKRTVAADGFRVELDLTSQVLAINLPEYEYDRGLDDKSGAFEAPLSPTLGKIDPGQPVSASVLAQKAKVFDDGLLAAVELATQDGVGRHVGKSGLLMALGRALVGKDPAVAGEVQALLLGAARLGQVAIPAAPPAVEPLVARAIQEFLADEKRSKPIGFYTWSERLSRIFQQDRMLQAELKDSAAIQTLMDALRADPALRAAYDALLRLTARLTNPFAAPDLRSLLAARDRGVLDPAEPGTRFFPPSAAHETEIIKRLFGNQPIPDGFVLVDEMVRRVRSGELNLEPRPESGWYDYQTWALEPLVIPERMPEGTRLSLADGYRGVLLELFKGLLTLTRESHIKWLEIPMVGSAMGPREVIIPIAPKLAAEPLPTFYLRRALGYRFARGVLEEAVGGAQLAGMHRLTPAGALRATLAEELAQIESLFMGAHVRVSRQLGLSPDASAGNESVADAASERFAAWAQGLDADPDLAQDLRTMVPVYYDIERNKTRVWAFLGWASRRVEVSYARPPKATILNRRGRPVSDGPTIRWGTLYTELAYPVTAEVYVDRILDREEFRRLCDGCGTRTEIMRKLGASGGTAPTIGA